jgi:adenylate kinase family enzyme
MKDIGIIKGNIHIAVKSVAVEGRGVILLTGPSSCGKGEIAKSISRFLSLPPARHLSMGSILRTTIQRARTELDFRQRLAEEYGISDRIAIDDPKHNDPHLAEKAAEHAPALRAFLGEKGPISQLDWLEYCVAKGLLVPDEWTQNIIAAVLENSLDLRQGIFILDGYPRTPAAARHLLATLAKLSIPVIKVLHLSITKQQMKIRALNRGRADDTEDSLERRYQFYVDKVQPCIDLIKDHLGNQAVALIDAHQPVYGADGGLDLPASIEAVTVSVMEALGLPRFLLDMD